MSVVTTLALMVTALVAKPKPDEIAKLKAQIDDLTRERDEMRDEADAWRAMSNRWQARYEQAANPALQREQLAQYQQAQNQHPAIQQGFLNQQIYAQALAQAQRQAFGEFCNCVPARHDMLLSG